MLRPLSNIQELGRLKNADAASVAPAEACNHEAVTSLWHRLFGRFRRDEIEREIEKEHMSPAERRIASQSVEDLQADQFVGEQFGGDLDIERRND
jgi:hypothetical protein